MADEPTPTTPAVVVTPPATPPAQDADSQPQDAIPPKQVGDLPDWAQNLVKELREENAKHRTEKQKAIKAQEEAVKKAAEEQGKFKELYEQEKQKADGLEPKVVAVEENLTAYRATVGEMLTKMVDALGEQAKNAVDNLPGEPDELAKLKWLNANEGLFKTSQKPAPLGTPKTVNTYKTPVTEQVPTNSQDYRPLVTL